jgi:hypothetical protein
MSQNPAPVAAPLIAISPEAHYELYHDWRKAVAFCRTVPDMAPPEAVEFHMFWRQRRAGFWRPARPFGRKQALPVKAFFATQDRSRASLVLWSDEDLSRNEWLRPFASSMTFRIYRPEIEVRGTPLEEHPELYRQQDGRVWRDSDLFRALTLHNHGGVYVDMDMVLLRSVGALLDQEFVYQWDDLDDEYNNAIMHLRRGSAFARELIGGIVDIPPGESNWGRANFRRAFNRGVRVAVFPSAFFDTDWQAEPRFEKTFRPFDVNRHVELYDGVFAWHWHNHWDDRIEHASKFQILETRIDERLERLGLGAGEARSSGSPPRARGNVKDGASGIL